MWRLHGNPKVKQNGLSEFSEVKTAWQNAVLLRWYLTEWCNYSCPYCPQDHSRARVKDDGSSFHCFDNYSPRRWVDALDRALQDKVLALTISGGEAMLDVKNMHEFLSLILLKKNVANVRIDTNLSWNLESYADLPNKEKVIFMCTFHPSQTKCDTFLQRATKLMNGGWIIGIVNYVMTPNQALDYKQLKENFSKNNLVLHPNPLWDFQPTGELAKMLKEELGETDYYYRAGGTTKGKTCLFPSIAYEMFANGDISVGCFSKLSSNIFRKNQLPQRPAGPVKCPGSICFCLDKYSFIKGMNRNLGLNTLKLYSNRIRQKNGMQLLP